MDRAKTTEKELRRQQWAASTSEETKAQQEKDRLAILRLKFRRKKLYNETEDARSGVALASMIRVNNNLEARMKKAAMAGFQSDRAKLRPEARAHHLAYGFLRGREYREMERCCYTAPNWHRVEAIALAHTIGDTRIFLQRLEQWLATAKTDCDIHIFGIPPDKHETRMKLERKLMKLRQAINALAT